MMALVLLREQGRSAFHDDAKCAGQRGGLTPEWTIRRFSGRLTEVLPSLCLLEDTRELSGSLSVVAVQPRGKVVMCLA